jgi:putative FmdB family regulatory protein
MPKYRYYCNDCEEEFFAYHSMSDTLEECKECSKNDIKKLITSPSYNTVTVNKEAKVGELTVQHIEDNRKILEEEKRKAREEIYEPS